VQKSGGTSPLISLSFCLKFDTTLPTILFIIVDNEEVSETWIGNYLGVEPLELLS